MSLEKNFNNKRFAIQPEQFAQERIHAMQDAVYELKETHPEIVSCVLFGSLTKGESTPASDIDGSLFLRQDALEDQHGDEVVTTPISESQKTFTVDRGGEEVEVPYIREAPHPQVSEEVADRYRTMLIESVRARVPDITDEQLADIHILPVSEEIITTGITNAVASFQELSQHVEQIRADEQYLAQVQESPIRVRRPPLEYLSYLFHLDIGGGIREFRAQLITKLMDTPNGEQIWQSVSKHIEAWEQKTDTLADLPTEVRYPRTLAEAYRVYGGAQG